MAAVLQPAPLLVPSQYEKEEFIFEDDCDIVDIGELSGMSISSPYFVSPASLPSYIFHSL
jgi:hypothetical protein